MTENAKKRLGEEKRDEQNGKKLEGDGTEPRTGHRREDLSTGKKNEDSGKKIWSEAKGKMWQC